MNWHLMCGLAGLTPLTEGQAKIWLPTQQQHGEMDEEEFTIPLPDTTESCMRAQGGRE